MQTDQINSEANDQTTTYGRFNSNPTPEQLEAYFTLTENDLLLVQRSRYDHTRLGVAVQLCTLKFFNTFLPDPSDVPEVVVGYLAEQLGISSFDLSKYVVTDDSKLRHRERIRDYLEYREFNDAARFGVARLLLSRLAIADEHPNVLFDTVTAWLVEHRIELPGATTLERFVTRIREHVSVALHRRLAARLSKAQTRRLEDLLDVPKEDTRTLFDRLRTEPSNLSSIGLGKAFERIRAIREVRVRSVNLEDVADNRLAPLVRSGLSFWASTLANYSVSRRLATLLALVQHLGRSSTDDALVVFDSVMRDLDLKGRKRRQQERLRNLKDLDAAALTLRDAARVILDSSIPASKVRATILQQLGEAQLFEAIAKVSDLASPAEDEEAEVRERAHGSLAQFVRPMLETLEFDGSPSAKPILEALAFIKRTMGLARSKWGVPPDVFVPKNWRSRIFPNGVNDDFNRSRYVVCALHQLHAALSRGDVFVHDSNAHGDPTAQLLEGDAWERVKPDVLRSLDLPAKPAVMILRLSKALPNKGLR